MVARVSWVPARPCCDLHSGGTGRSSSEICCTARRRFLIPAATATPAWPRNKQWPVAVGFSGGRLMNGNCSSPGTSVVRVPWKSDGTALDSSSAHGRQPTRRRVRPPRRSLGPTPPTVRRGPHRLGGRRDRRHLAQPVGVHGLSQVDPASRTELPTPGLEAVPHDAHVDRPARAARASGPSCRCSPSWASWSR